MEVGMDVTKESLFEAVYKFLKYKAHWLQFKVKEIGIRAETIGGLVELSSYIRRRYNCPLWW